MVQILHKEIYDNKVNLIVNDKVKTFDTNKVILESGKEINTKAVVLAIGVAPETRLAKDAGLEIGKTGAIKVDEKLIELVIKIFMQLEMQLRFIMP